jgi:uncharacterized repeat protein (TIGR03847 family)
MSRSFELPEAEWATVGAVGEPGHRTFYLQARQDTQLVTLKLEKQHVAAIAQFLSEILDDLPSTGTDAFDGAENLVEPVLAEWAVGTLQIAYDNAADRIVILAEELGADDEEDDVEELIGDPEDDPMTLGHPSRRGERREPSDETTTEADPRGAARIGITRASAALIVRVGVDLVISGRPTCGLCGRPMDPEGHSCPRTNGHKPN